MRRQLMTLFQAEGDFDIRQARNGEEAVRENREFQPDVVTLGHQHAGDGRFDRAFPHHGRAAGRGGDGLLAHRTGALATFEALNLGAVDYIAKPGGTISLSIDRSPRSWWQGARGCPGPAKGKNLGRRRSPACRRSARKATRHFPRWRPAGWPARAAGNRRIHRRTAGAGDCSVGIAGEFSLAGPGGAAHAGGVYQGLRRAAESMLRAACDEAGSALPVEAGQGLHRQGRRGHAAGQPGGKTDRSYPRRRTRSTCGTLRSSCWGDRCCSTTIRSGSRRCC
jgi:hypothetical protein